MPLPTPDPVIDASQITVTYSLSYPNGINCYQKFVPRVWDGTVYDCTDAFSAIMVFDNGRDGITNKVAQSSTVGIILSDATGLELCLDAGTILQMATLGAISGRYVLIITDQSISVPIAGGRWNLNMIA